MPDSHPDPIEPVNLPAGGPIRVLFVCMGNICRSPLAEGVLRRMVEDQGLSGAIEIDSAGTGPWHVGERPDARMRATARRNGLSLDELRGRQLQRLDLRAFHHVFVMDKRNLHDALALDPHGDHGTRVRLFREFDPEPEDYQVPDPYTGGIEGFDAVYAIVARTCAAILERLKAAYGLEARTGAA